MTHTAAGRRPRFLHRRAAPIRRLLPERPVVVHVQPDARAALFAATKEFAQEDRAASRFHFTTTLTLMAGLVAVAAVHPWWWTRLAASLLAGLVTVRFFILYHDHQHGSILKGSRFVTAVMTLYGWLTLNPPSIWSASHNHHHKTNAKIWGEGVGAFPTIRVQDYEAAPRPLRVGYRIARSPLTIALGYFTVFLGLTCVRAFVQHPRKHWDAGGAIVLQALLVAALAWWAPSALLYAMAIPLVLAGAIGTYLFYAQHNFPGVKLGQEPWDYVSAALESSSYMKLSPLLHWLTGNIGYHHVHHLNPRIPFYRLPEAMAAIPRLQVPEAMQTTLSLRDIAACLRLKLWDSRKGRMVGWNGE